MRKGNTEAPDYIKTDTIMSPTNTFHNISRVCLTCCCMYMQEFMPLFCHTLAVLIGRSTAATLSPTQLAANGRSQRISRGEAMPVSLADRLVAVQVGWS